MARDTLSSSVKSAPTVHHPPPQCVTLAPAPAYTPSARCHTSEDKASCTGGDEGMALLIVGPRPALRKKGKRLHSPVYRMRAVGGREASGGLKSRCWWGGFLPKPGGAVCSRPLLASAGCYDLWCLLGHNRLTLISHLHVAFALFPCLHIIFPTSESLCPNCPFF